MFSLITIDIFSPYMIIIEASLILVYSFFCGILAKKTNIPSVLMLIIGGILTSVALKQFEVEELNLFPYLEVLGIVGLIMIVLEAALDLEITRKKVPLIGNSLVIALVCLIGSVFLIALVLQQMLNIDYLTGVLYATPLSIMSSAIIIPSVESLVHERREFMIYESAFSDILGIMFFYFVVSWIEQGSRAASIQFFSSLIITIIVSILASYAIVWVFKDMKKGQTRLFLLIAVLLILYSAGKLLHLSPLIIILVFGLSLANHNRFFKIFRNDMNADEDDGIERIEKEFHLITLETAFVVRTFFFFIFGMTINLASLIDVQVLLQSLAILAILGIVRWIVLKFFLKRAIVPELYIAPRGLITILLFFAIPPALSIEQFDSGILLYVIIISSLIMTYGLIQDKKSKSAEEPVLATVEGVVSEDVSPDSDSEEEAGTEEPQENQ